MITPSRQILSPLNPSLYQNKTTRTHGPMNLNPQAYSHGAILNLRAAALTTLPVNLIFVSEFINPQDVHLSFYRGLYYAKKV